MPTKLRPTEQHDYVMECLARSVADHGWAPTDFERDFAPGPTLYRGDCVKHLLARFGRAEADFRSSFAQLQQYASLKFLRPSPIVPR